jgi:hypothetical protein
VTGSNLRAVLRFWWLMLLGVVAGGAVATVMLYRVDLGLPPTLTERAARSYVASTELLVDSPTGPYLRAGIGVTRPVQIPQKTPRGQSEPATTETESTVVTDRKALLEAANLFPLLIESDEVSAIRARMMGAVPPGQVRAKALYSLQGENRFRPSVLPVIQIIAQAPSPAAAIRLTRGTAKAFNVWLAAEQRRADVPPKQRVVVRQLRVPRFAVSMGGTSYGLPLLAAAVVVFGFAGLAVLLDRAFPRGPAALERIAALVEVSDSRRERSAERAGSTR